MAEPWVRQRDRTSEISRRLPLVPGFKYVPFNDINALKNSRADYCDHARAIQGEGDQYRQ